MGPISGRVLAEKMEPSGARRRASRIFHTGPWRRLTKHAYASERNRPAAEL